MKKKSIESRLKAADPVKSLLLDESILLAATEATPKGLSRVGLRLKSPKLKFSLSVVAGAATLLIFTPLLNSGTSVTPLIQLGANSQAGPEAGLANGQAANPRALAGQSDEANKMMMPNPFTYEYVAGSGLSDNTGTGRVYQLALNGTARAVLATVAKALEIPGDSFVPDYSSPEYPDLSIGSKDYTGAGASISWSGTGNWWYNNPAAYPAPECLEFTKADDGSEYCSKYAEQKPSPEMQPSKSQMISEAVRIFSATGLKVSPAEVVANINEWGSSAYASLKLDGQDTALEWSLGWGANGQLAYASGHSVKAIDRGEFTTISDRAAVSRMTDWRYSGSISQKLWAKYQTNSNWGIAFDSPVVRVEGEPEELPASEPGVEQPQETVPEPKLVTVVIDKVVGAPVMIWDKSGAAWIVPGAILIGDQGWITPVFTLQDGVVELPEPGEISQTE